MAFIDQRGRGWDKRSVFSFRITIGALLFMVMVIVFVAVPCGVYPNPPPLDCLS
jgi:uncharacterized membrane protein